MALTFALGLVLCATVKSEETAEVFDLFATAARGDIAGVQSRLETHPEWVNAEQARKTLLWEAAERGDTNMIALLLRFKANIEARDRQASRTPLCIAVCNDHKNAVEMLLQNKADPNTTSHSGFSILHMCGSKETIELLLAYKADVNARDITKRTPLHWAVQHTNVEKVEILLSNGADVDARDYMGSSPLHVASQATVAGAIGVIDGPYRPTPQETEDLRTKIREIILLLLSHKADIESRDVVRFTPLIRGAECGNDEQVGVLIAHGADVNAKDSSGCTALCRALENRHTDTAKILVEKGANIDVFAAASLGITNRLESFLDANRDSLNTKGFLDRTPLHWAVDNGQIDAVAMLVGRGADLKVRDVYGWTPLAVSVQRGRADILRLLVARHADVNTKDRFGKSALAAATELREREIVDILQQNSAQE